MNVNEISSNSKEAVQCKVYKRRWLILALFCLYALSNRYQYIMYSVIADIIVDYYGIPNSTANWTSLISVVECIIFNIPGAFFLNKVGPRWTVIIGLTGTCIGSWVKVASVDPSRFWVLLLGQGITGLCQVLVTALPGKIAAAWFAKDQVSLACSIGVMGILIDAVFGFLIPPMIVKRGSVKEVEHGLSLLAYGTAAFPTILLPFVLIFFENAPPVPPSAAQSSKDNEKVKVHFIQSLQKILSNRSFVIFLVIFGICNGSAFPILIIANELILLYHPEAVKDVGYIGAFCMGFGLIATILFGFLLDKYKRFREITITAFTLYALCAVVFFSTLSIDVYLIYLTASVTGFLGMGLTAIAFSVGVEFTYPEPEGISGGLLLMICQIFGLIFTYIYTYLFNNESDLVSNIVIGCILFGAVSLFMFVKFDLRRQEFEKHHGNNTAKSAKY